MSEYNVYFLKLVGAEKFGSPRTGSLVKGQCISTDDEDFALRLLDKGSKYQDGNFRPVFLQVTEEEAQEANAKFSEVKRAVRSRRTNAKLDRNKAKKAEAPVATAEGEPSDTESDGTAVDTGATDGAATDGEKAKKVTTTRTKRSTAASKE